MVYTVSVNAIAIKTFVLFLLFVLNIIMWGNPFVYKVLNTRIKRLVLFFSVQENVLIGVLGPILDITLFSLFFFSLPRKIQFKAPWISRTLFKYILPNSHEVHLSLEAPHHGNTIKAKRFPLAPFAKQILHIHHSLSFQTVSFSRKD